MKNLELMCIESKKIESLLKPSLCCYWLDNLYIVSGSDLCIFESSECRHASTLTIPTDGSIVYIDACLASDRLVLCSSNGDLLSLDYGGSSLDYVGCIDPGIEASCWSLGGEVLAIVTSSLKVVFLNHDLDPVSEVELQNIAEEQHVSVGWGKSETQFRGSEGKLKKDNKETSETVEKYDDGKVRISWRGDGQFLVVSYLEKNMRQLKVLSRDGLLLHSLEQHPGLQCALSWRPNGSLIASCQRLPNKQIICFFEKNLLPHGDFTIDKECVVHDLLWNSDSSILGVIVVENSNWMVKLYTSSNYHWYHKYTVKPFPSEKSVSIFWDPEDATLLHLITATDTSIRHSRFVNFCNG